MSDDDRALASRRVLTPVRGVPIHAPEGDDFTPVTVIFERIETELGDELTARERRIVTALVRHDANQELRTRKRSDSQETGTLVKRIDELETSVVDISGKHGTNGKLGALKDRVDRAEARRWWLITFVAGLVVAVVTAAVAFGRWQGTMQAELDAVKARMDRARSGSPPEFPASKETQP